ncbi:MAG: hypothetical protein P4M08_10355 [Oligoflexia bacterium]|nr:hypothetical protein [Oligoflexia bacterium]
MSLTETRRDSIIHSTKSAGNNPPVYFWPEGSTLPVYFWNEEDLEIREKIIAHITAETRALIQGLHSRMKIRRIEYPSIVPFSDLRDRPHEAWRLAGTDLALSTGEGEGGCVPFLREVMKEWTPETLPVSYQYQSKNFRSENPRYTGPFRSLEFWQLDWDCYWVADQVRFAPEETQVFSTILEPIIGPTYMKPEPEQTKDGAWRLNFDILSDVTDPAVEVAGYSTRSQQPPFVEWKGPELHGFNISYGIDRLVTAYKLLNRR